MKSMVPRTIQIAVDFMSEPREVERLVNLSEQGDARAQTLLGGMYYEGRGVPRDYDEALKWYSKAAGQGEADACYAIGGMHYIGHGVPKDPAEALEWFRRAAEKNHADAQRALGWIYERGQGVARDRDEAVKWFLRAAEQGHKGAKKQLLKMGVSLESKDGGLAEPEIGRRDGAGAQPQDHPDDVKDLIRLAERNDGQAQYKLGRKYYEGNEVPKSSGKAMKLFRKAAEQGVIEAQFSLGNAHYEHAVKWFSKAAQQGHPKAQFSLAMMFLDGHGVTRDVEEAIRWFRKAAKQGHPKAATELEKLGLG